MPSSHLLEIVSGRNRFYNNRRSVGDRADLWVAIASHPELLCPWIKSYPLVERREMAGALEGLVLGL